MHLDSMMTISGASNTTVTAQPRRRSQRDRTASGTVAAGKYLGLNARNQAALGTAVLCWYCVNGMTAATGNTIDNAAYGQTWSWNSLPRAQRSRFRPIR